jgi:hypothetical protein
MIPTLLSWSSGKDSAWSLHVLRQKKEHEIVGLLTTFNRAADRVAMHGVRRTLVQAQAEAARIPLWDVHLPWPCTNEDYECAMAETYKKAVAHGMECIAFGDLFLADIRAYREKQLRCNEPSCKKETSQRSSDWRGNAVTPLTTRPAMKATSQKRMRRRCSVCVIYDVDEEASRGSGRRLGQRIGSTHYSQGLSCSWFRTK